MAADGRYWVAMFEGGQLQALDAQGRTTDVLPVPFAGAAVGWTADRRGLGVMHGWPRRRSPARQNGSGSIPRASRHGASLPRLTHHQRRYIMPIHR